MNSKTNWNPCRRLFGYDVWRVECLGWGTFNCSENIIRQKEKVVKHYNKKVRRKSFWIRDLVWKVILPMDKKSKVLGKWLANWDGPYIIEKVFSRNAYEIREVNKNSYIGSINGKYLKTYTLMLIEINILTT